MKCGILKKKASKNPVMHWKEKYVIITIGKLIWLPISSGMREKGDITITDRMRKKQHCMSGRFADSSAVVLDENTEPRCSLNRKKNVNHVFDVIYKRTSRAPLDLNSIERLEAYVKAVASSTGLLHFPSHYSVRHFPSHCSDGTSGGRRWRRQGRRR